MRPLLTLAVAAMVCVGAAPVADAQSAAGSPAPPPVPPAVAPPSPPPGGPTAPPVSPAPAPAPSTADPVPPPHTGPTTVPTPGADAPAVPSPAPPPPAPAEPPPPAHYQPLGRAEAEIEPGAWDPWAHPLPGAFDHRGFYLRMSIGLGAAGIRGDHHVLVGVDDVTLTGLDLAFSFAVGGAIADNLILNADLFGARVLDPQVEQDGKDLGDADRLALDLGIGERFEIGGFGIGVTYYIMPINLYLAGSVGIGRVVFENADGERGGSDLGFAANVMVGKEWWVAPEWGIGLAGQLVMLSAEDDILGTVSGLGVNLMFSATYN